MSNLGIYKIIWYKVIISPGIYNERRNELTVYTNLCRNVTIFYRQEPASLIQMMEKFTT